MYRTINFSGEKEKLIALIAARTGTPRSEMNARSIPELEQLLNESLLAQIRAEAQNSPAAIEAEERIAEIKADRLRAAREQQLTLIFRTPVNGRVALDNQANRSIITGWPDETRDERISPAWFVQVLAENPSLASQLSWQNADVLDPQKRRQAATAQAQQDRKTFAAAERKYGLSDNEASFRLICETLGEGFSEYAVGEAMRNGTVQVSSATEAELEQYRQEAAEERQQFLRNADVETLRGIVRSEAEQNRQRAVQEQVARADAARAERDRYQGYPPMPDTWQGQPLNSEFIKKCSTETLKILIRRFGSDQTTRALRERI